MPTDYEFIMENDGLLSRRITKLALKVEALEQQVKELRQWRERHLASQAGRERAERELAYVRGGR